MKGTERWRETSSCCGSVEKRAAWKHFWNEDMVGATRVRYYEDKVREGQTEMVWTCPQEGL